MRNCWRCCGRGRGEDNNYNRITALRQFQLTPEAEPILDSVAQSFGGEASLALSELLIAHESIESFLGEIENANSEDLIRQRDHSPPEFRDGMTISQENVKLGNGRSSFSRREPARSSGKSGLRSVAGLREGALHTLTHRL